ncbi:hypothetical protein AUP68_11888 [Ilyonectria robusta]
MSNAVRILEATTSGRVELRHDPKVTLEAGGSYQIFISAQSKSTGNGSLGDDFGLLTIMLYNKNDRAFEAKPGKGIPLGMDWYSWQWSFSLDESQGGEYYFSILADASGLELDWISPAVADSLYRRIFWSIWCFFIALLDIIREMKARSSFFKMQLLLQLIEVLQKVTSWTRNLSLSE